MNQPAPTVSPRALMAICALGVIGIVTLVYGVHTLRTYHQKAALQETAQQYLEARRAKHGEQACALISKQARNLAYGPTTAACVRTVESPRFHFDRVPPFQISSLEILDGEGHVLATSSRQSGKRRQHFDWRLHFLWEDGAWRLKEDSLLQPVE